MNIILLTLVFMMGAGKTTITMEFDTMEACNKELMAYMAYLHDMDIKPIKAGCGYIRITREM